MKIGTINEPASLGDTPPSSDSGVHSLGEQWKNMSTNCMDMESEQNERPTYGSTMRWRVSDTCVPPNTEEDEDIDYPWADRLLDRESDENSSIDIQQNDRKFQYNEVTIYVSENSTVNSGTDGRNSDIGVLSDFSDDDEETWVEQLSGCRIPGCQCDGCVAVMEWGSDDMTETDDSEYEGSIDRANRLYVESYNYDLSEGMTPKTYNPPLRRNRRRRYEVRKKNEVDVEESIIVTSDRPIRNHPNWNRRFNRGRLLMTISPNRGIKRLTADAGHVPEVIKTFQVMKIRICSTDRSRSRRRHGIVRILRVQVIWNIGTTSAARRNK